MEELMRAFVAEEPVGGGARFVVEFVAPRRGLDAFIGSEVTLPGGELIADAGEAGTAGLVEDGEPVIAGGVEASAAGQSRRDTADRKSVV